MATPLGIVAAVARSKALTLRHATSFGVATAAVAIFIARVSASFTIE
jgi:hypothetical protein